MKIKAKILITAAVAIIAASNAFGAVRIKDLAKVEGVRENQLFGYGLVVGLAGTGDRVNMTKQTVANMMERLGIVVNVQDINVDNVAAVMVTASLPAFVKPGDNIDVVVSSLGDADSLQGGTLVMTPIKGADGRVYAVAQGPLSIGGWTAGGAGAGRDTKGHPTVARIPGGATVEREVAAELVVGDSVHLSLNNPDFTTATNVVDGINRQFGPKTAKALNASTIEIVPPAKSVDNMIPFLSQIENIMIEQDQVNRVVINEKTGTIVMGGDVTITPVAIAHGSITVTIKPRTEIFQPDTPFAGGGTVAVENVDLDVTEQKVSFSRVSTSDVVDAMNKLGVAASDIIAILQALKAAGALQAEIVLM